MTTPNTPTPDLDRDAFKKAMQAFFAEDPYERYPDTHACVKAAIKAYEAALPPASGAEPVAWRYDLYANGRWFPTTDKTIAERIRAEGRPIEPLYAAPTPPSASDEKLGRFGNHPDPAIDFEVEVQALEDEFSNLQASFTNGTPTMAELEARVFRAMDFRVGGDLGAISAKAALRALEARMKAAPTPSSVVMEAWRDNLENAWAALHMIREAIGELFGPKASLEGPDAVLLRGPEPVHEAEAIVAALQRVAAPTSPSASSRDEWGNLDSDKGDTVQQVKGRIAFWQDRGNYACPPSSVLTASSGDGELSRKKKRDGIKILSDEEEAAILSATSDMLGGSLAIQALENLHAQGFSIVRTAPSGEQG